MAAIFLGPGHAEPAALTNALAEFGIVRVLALGLVRIESAGGDFLGEERADFLAQLLAFGRQADRIETKGCSHVKDLVSCVRSARRDQRPQLVGTARSDQFAELDRPVALAAEIIAPCQCAQRVAMQDVLLREADGPKNLMRDGGALFGGLGATDLCSGGLEEERVVKRCPAGEGVSRGTGSGEGCRGLACELRQIVLHRLEFRDLLLERHALAGIVHADAEHGFQCTGNLLAAHECAHQQQRVLIEARWCRLKGHRLHSVEMHCVGWVIGQTEPSFNPAGAGVHQRNRGAADAGGDDGDVFRIRRERHAARAAGDCTIRR